jgi:nitroreductase
LRSSAALGQRRHRRGGSADRPRDGPRAERYVTLEAGHVAQNIALQAVALDLGSVPIGAFDDAGVAEVLQLAQRERVLYILPLGRPAAGDQE